MLGYIATQQTQRKDRPKAPTPPSLFRRIGLALSVLFNADLAAKLQRVQDEGEQPAVDG